MSDQASKDTGDLQSQFLILCLRSRFQPAALDLARNTADQAGFDWLALYELIDEERLAPLLYATVREHNLLPAQLENKLREAYLHNGIRNTLLLKELDHVIDTCKHVGIELLILKGAALAETIYNNIAIRPMVDLDVLVRQEDADKALQQLVLAGYDNAAAETRRGSLLTYENELLLQKKGKVDVALELHWSLLDSPHYQSKIDMNWFWQTGVPAFFSGTPGQSLGAEALLLHLCAHLMLHHQGQGLLWLHDIAEVLMRFSGRLDWELVLNKAQEYDLVLSLQHILPKVCLMWHISLPAGTLKAIGAANPSSRELKVFSWLTIPERPVAQRFWSDLASSNNWRLRLEYGWQSIFPSPDYMRRRYKIKRPLLLPLYYPYRWLLGTVSVFK